MENNDDKDGYPGLYQLHNGIAISGTSLEDNTPAMILEKRESNQRLHELAGR